MNTDEIKDHAAIEADNYLQNAPILSGPRGSYRKGFIAGALWQLAAPWHGAKEEPEREGEWILVEYHDWGMDENFYDVTDDLRRFKERYYSDIVRWAYISDLVPTKIANNKEGK